MTNTMTALLSLTYTTLTTATPRQADRELAGCSRKDLLDLADMAEARNNRDVYETVYEALESRG